jgi:prepilin-type N-terminal cleavage/methylation domain-containing protein
VRQPRAGYTLFELVIVLAVLVIMATLAVPSWQSASSTMRLTESADILRTAWATARAHAINEGRAYRFAYVPNHGNYRIAPDSSDQWGGSTGPEQTDNSTPPYVQEDVLPKGVRFSSAEVVQSANGHFEGGDTALPPGSVQPSGWTTAVTFQPDGSAQDVEVIFTTEGSRPLSVKLRGLTGAVTVKNMNSTH